MARPEKAEKVAQLKELFEGASSIFVTDYQGLDVAQATALRKSLRESNIKYVVAKNTLLRIAAKEAGFDSTVTDAFSGPTAVAFCANDPSVPAKILYDSYKDLELPRTKVFVVEAHVHQGDDIKRLADLPPREVLLSQLVSAVEAPLTSVVNAIEALHRELIGTIDALADKLKGEE
jgi:large subunit ribosomal protein L10